MNATLLLAIVFVLSGCAHDRFTTNKDAVRISERHTNSSTMRSNKLDLRVEFVCYEGGEQKIRLRFENRSAWRAHFTWTRNDWWINDDALAQIASTDTLMRKVTVESNQVRVVSLIRVASTNSGSTTLNVTCYSHPAQRHEIPVEFPPFIPGVDQFIDLNSRPVLPKEK